MHRQRMTQDDEPRPCAECGTMIGAGNDVTLDQGESFCSGECAYHHSTGGMLTLREEIEAERFAHGLATGGFDPIDEDCARCGRPFYPNRDGADGYYCKPCLPLQAAEAAAYFRIHPEEEFLPRLAPFTKLQGGRIVVDAEALELDKISEEN